MDGSLAMLQAQIAESQRRSMDQSVQAQKAMIGSGTTSAGIADNMATGHGGFNANSGSALNQGGENAGPGGLPLGQDDGLEARLAPIAALAKLVAQYGTMGGTGGAMDPASSGSSTLSADNIGSYLGNFLGPGGSTSGLAQAAERSGGGGGGGSAPQEAMLRGGGGGSQGAGIKVEDGSEYQAAYDQKRSAAIEMAMKVLQQHLMEQQLAQSQQQTKIGNMQIQAAPGNAAARGALLQQVMRMISGFR